MRAVLSAFAAASAFASTPALAGANEASELAEELSDPARQVQLATMIETMGAVMLDIPIAPLLRATAQMEGRDPEAIDPDLTVRHLAGPKAEDTPREMARRLPQMMGAMAALAGSLEQMLPHLRAMGDTLAEPYGHYAD